MLGRVAARMLGGALPAVLASKSLHYFKALVQTGEIPTTERQPAARPDPADEEAPMRALIWNGVNDLRVETVKDPEIVNPHDCILRVTMSTTCGSDLHFIDGYIRP